MCTVYAKGVQNMRSDLTARITRGPPVPGRSCPCSSRTLLSKGDGRIQLFDRKWNRPRCFVSRRVHSSKEDHASCEQERNGGGASAANGGVPNCDGGIGYSACGGCFMDRRLSNLDTKSEIYILRSDGYSCSRETVTCTC